MKKLLSLLIFILSFNTLVKSQIFPDPVSTTVSINNFVTCVGLMDGKVTVSSIYGGGGGYHYTLEKWIPSSSNWISWGECPLGTLNPNGTITMNFTYNTIVFTNLGGDTSGLTHYRIITHDNYWPGLFVSDNDTVYFDIYDFALYNNMTTGPPPPYQSYYDWWVDTSGIYPPNTLLFDSYQTNSLNPEWDMGTTCDPIWIFKDPINGTLVDSCPLIGCGAYIYTWPTTGLYFEVCLITCGNYVDWTCIYDSNGMMITPPLYITRDTFCLTVGIGGITNITEETSEKSTAYDPNTYFKGETIHDLLGRRYDCSYFDLPKGMYIIKRNEKVWKIYKM